MKFQIKKIILWPRNEQFKFKEVKFELNAVNVITGASRTGKSAIIPIIDYCLASGSCYIPTQTIRKACSWFGVLVDMEGKELLLARREPGVQKSTDDMMIISGERIEIPDIPEKNTTRPQVKIFLDEQAKLSFIDVDESYFGNRPSYRDMMSFCFQPQNVVANANVLFYKCDTTEHRNTLISIFPYILGAVTPEVLSARQELVEKQRILKKKERDYEQLCKLTEQWEEEIKTWISMSIELGLISEDKRNIDFNSQVNLLKSIVNSKTEETIIKSRNIFDNGEEIIKLREQENQIAIKLTKLRNRYIEMSQLLRNRESYRDALQIQIERLNVAKWMKKKAEEQNCCPLCQQRYEDDKLVNKYLSKLVQLEEKRDTINEVPVAFEREYIVVKNEIEELTEKLRAVQKRIVIEQGKKNSNNIDSPERYSLDGISRFLGKIEYASQTLQKLGEDGELAEEIASLKKRIIDLRKIADETVIKSKIESSLRRISVNAMELVKTLDVERPDAFFELDYKNLTVIVDGEDGRKDYLWEIGSGSNWLSYHLAIMLGMQIFFSSFKSSVPNFMVFDQPSQVYFPHLDKEDEEKGLIPEDVDTNAVKGIFRTMINCVSKMNNEMQIIVLEHADDSIYGDIEGVHEICNWRNGNKLVPVEWIE